MSALGERTLILLLTDTESLEEVARKGLNPMIVPTVPFREVVTWTMIYHQNNGKAPTADILRERFTPDRFTDQQIDLDDDVEETIGWALDDLTGTWIQQQVGIFTRKLATEIGSCAPEDRYDRLGALSSEMGAMVLDLAPRTTQIDIRESGPSLLAEYEYAATSDGIRGMRLGLPEVDAHRGGIWPGELVVIGGPAGSGKSYLADLVAYNEWSRGVNTTIYTLENSILMNQMRIACCALHMSIEDLQNGTLPDAEVARLREWCNDVLVNSDTPLNIVSPDMVNRSPQALVQAARAYETESLIIDQLTHIEPVDANNQQKRNYEVAKIVRTLGNLINTGNNRLPCLLLHQINREGIKEASRTGRLNMTHMAESGEIERMGAGVMSLYQSDEHKALGRMQLQSLKERRVKAKHFDLAWQPWYGLVHVISEVDFTDVMPDPEVGAS